MPEILSQQEIDSLLSGISTGVIETTQTQVEEKKVEREAITFDFRLPHRLSKNQLRTFQAVHESFGEMFGSYLVGRLQTTVTVSSPPSTSSSTPSSSSPSPAPAACTSSGSSSPMRSPSWR